MRNKKQLTLSINQVLENSHLKYKTIKNSNLRIDKNLEFLGEICRIKIYKNGTKYLFQDQNTTYITKITKQNYDDFISNLIIFYLNSNFLKRKS